MCSNPQTTTWALHIVREEGKKLSKITGPFVAKKYNSLIFIFFYFLVKMTILAISCIRCLYFYFTYLGELEDVIFRGFRKS